jgi:hypothetical protein
MELEQSASYARTMWTWMGAVYLLYIFTVLPMLVGVLLYIGYDVALIDGFIDAWVYVMLIASVLIGAIISAQAENDNVMGEELKSGQRLILYGSLVGWLISLWYLLQRRTSKQRK